MREELPGGQAGRLKVSHSELMPNTGTSHEVGVGASMPEQSLPAPGLEVAVQRSQLRMEVMQPLCHIDCHLAPPARNQRQGGIDGI